MKAIALALALLAVGCAPSGPLDVGYEGSGAGYAKALAAADYWNATCGETLIVVHRGDGDVQLREQSGMPDGQYGETFKSRPAFGAIGPKEPYLIKYMGGGSALGVITHEFGHALGIEEHTSDATIMNPAISGGYYKNWHEDAVGTDGNLRAGLVTADDCARVSGR